MHKIRRCNENELNVEVSFDCHLVLFVTLLVPLQIKDKVKEGKQFF